MALAIQQFGRPKFQIHFIYIDKKCEGPLIYDKYFKTVSIDDALVTLLAVLGVTNSSLNDNGFYDDQDWTEFNGIGCLWKRICGDAADDIAMILAICTKSGKWAAGFLCKKQLRKAAAQLVMAIA